jgi:hypothetical protein
MGAGADLLGRQGGPGDEAAPRAPQSCLAPSSTRGRGALAQTPSGAPPCFPSPSGCVAGQTPHTRVLHRLGHNRHGRQCFARGRTLYTLDTLLAGKLPLAVPPRGLNGSTARNAPSLGQNGAKNADKNSGRRRLFANEEGAPLCAGHKHRAPVAADCRPAPQEPRAQNRRCTAARGLWLAPAAHAAAQARERCASGARKRQAAPSRAPASAPKLATRPAPRCAHGGAPNRPRGAARAWRRLAPRNSQIVSGPAARANARSGKGA